MRKKQGDRPCLRGHSERATFPLNAIKNRHGIPASKLYNSPRKDRRSQGDAGSKYRNHAAVLRCSFPLRALNANKIDIAIVIGRPL